MRKKLADAAQRANSWLLAYKDLVLGLDLPWAEPNWTTSDFREVVLEWWFDTRKATLYVSGKSIEYLCSDDSWMDDGAVRDMLHMLDIWRWLLGARCKRLPAMTALDKFEELGTNWGGYTTPRAALLAAARDVLRTSTGAFTPDPEVTLEVDGDIQLIWKNGARELGVRITDELLVLFWKATGLISENGTLPRDASKEIKELLDWLLDG